MKPTATTSCIDATGLLCPQPLRLLKQTVQGLPQGAVVQITVTDVHAELDFVIWCERFGHGLEKISDCDDQWVFAIEVNAVDGAS